MNRQLCLDTETTGISWRNGHRIIEIGIIELVDRLPTGNDYHVYLNPQRLVEQSAMAVHGITDEFLEDKPTFREVADDLLAYLGDSELIIHNAQFDMGFLNMEFNRLKVTDGFDLAENRVVTDTLVLAKKKHVGQKNNLDALCKRYGIDSSGRVLHGALLDADLLASVYLSMTRTQHALFSNKDEKKSCGSDLQGVDNSKLIIKTASADEVASHDAFAKQYFD